MIFQLQSGILKNEEDRKTVANAMETQVSALLKDRNEVPDENEEEQDVNNEQNPSSPEPPPSPPPSPVPTNHPVLQNNNHSIDPMTLQYQSLQQSKDMDVIKSHGTERLAVSNTVSETLAVENPQHSSKNYIRLNVRLHTTTVYNSSGIKLLHYIWLFSL